LVFHGSRFLEIYVSLDSRREKASIRFSLPFILGAGCVGQGFTVPLRIRLDVTVRVFQEREEILVGSESFDGLSVGGQESK
jgi:hypothetical protein